MRTVATTTMILATLVVSLIFLTASAADSYHAPTDPQKSAERMASSYMDALNTLTHLTQQPITPPSSSSIQDDDKSAHAKSMLLKGKHAFETALKVFPDETLPHAHALFAKLCIKAGAYRQALNLFDEAIRRASLPSNDGAASTDAGDPAEADPLVRQLVRERIRARFLLLRSEVSEWDDANNRLHGGGIPPETSPLELLPALDGMLEIFPDHPQVLHDRASFLVLSSDAPEDSDGEESTNSTARAREAHDLFRKAQLSAYVSYAHGKNRRLAGGKPCRRGRGDFGLLVGGGARSEAAGANSTPFSYDETAGDGDDSYVGMIALPNVVISGRDAVLSGYGTDCRVYPPHPYVNLANSLPMVTSWDAELEGDESEMASLSIHSPEGNDGAYGGSYRKDNNGNGNLVIPDPKLSSRTRFRSALLLTGYGAHNYYHFVSEVLPSLVATREYSREILDGSREEGKANRDVIIIPNLQHEFVEGFVRLLLPEAFVGGDELSPRIVQWGPGGRPNGDDEDRNAKFDTSHPIAYAERLVSVAWDQPARAPPPSGGPPHCLTPAPLLRAMRREVRKAVGASRGTTDDENDDDKLRVVYCSRSSSPTRRLAEEEELLSRIEEEASKIGAEVIVFERTADDDGTPPLEFVMDAIRLFQSAAVVVGVHGASLANIAFADAGTTVVEMGYESLSQASHYRHLSRALELRHVDVFLAKDARSLGATEVSLRSGGVESVVKAVVEGLERGKMGKMGDHSEL